MHSWAWGPWEQYKILVHHGTLSCQMFFWWLIPQMISYHLMLQLCRFRLLLYDHPQSAWRSRPRVINGHIVHLPFMVPIVVTLSPSLLLRFRKLFQPLHLLPDNFWQLSGLANAGTELNRRNWFLKQMCFIHMEYWPLVDRTEPGATWRPAKLEQTDFWLCSRGSLFFFNK